MRFKKPEMQHRGHVLTPQELRPQEKVVPDRMMNTDPRTLAFSHLERNRARSEHTQRGHQ